MKITKSNRIRVTDHFFLDELIHPDFYDGTKRPLLFLDRRIIEGLELLRKKIDVPFTVNNWASGGTRMFSGLRPCNAPIGAKYSQHKFGRAIDFVCRLSPAEVLEVIRKMEGELVQSGRVTRVEDVAFTTTWNHIDCGYTGLDEILIVKP